MARFDTLINGARRVVLAAALALACSAPFARADVPAASWTQLLHELLPAVVNITVHTEQSAPGAGKIASARSPDIKRYFGSGFVIDPSGLILTNYHVVEGAYQIRVTFNNGSILPGKFLHASRIADLAIIQVTANHPLTSVTWGDSTRLQVGDPVVAIGNPLGVGMSVSAGIVSALDRNVEGSPYDDYIQTDAAINHGNSGGPLFDMEGHVVGVDSALLSPTQGSAGLGLAIPSDTARFVIDRLMTYGWVRPGWIGVKVQQVTPDIASAMGLARAEGSVISYLPADSPAQQAGIQVGDVILQYNNATPMNERALLRDIVHTPAGDRVPIVVLRDNKQLTLPVTVAVWPRSKWDERDAPLPAEQPDATIPRDLGLSLTAIPPAEHAKLGLEDDWKGVLVSRVMPGSDAARRGITNGDVILRVQQQPVALPADVQHALDAERAAKHRFVAILVLQKQRNVSGPSWVALRLD